MQELKRGLEVLYGQEIVSGDVVVWRRLPSPPIQQSSDYITTVSVCAGAVALLVLLISAIVRFIRRRGARARALKAARESRGSTPKLALSASNSDVVATEEASSKSR